MRIRRVIASAILAGATVGMFAVATPATASPAVGTDTITISSDFCSQYKKAAEKYFKLAEAAYRAGKPALSKAYQAAGKAQLKKYHACKR